MLDKLMTPETKKLFKAMDRAGFEMRFVGGCVRDVMLGVTPKDIDFCTDATPGEMKDVATINNFTYVPTGVEHGTATLIVDGEPFEVTTLRVDAETDGRHATVEFTRSFEQDAARRDLTINSMSMDKDGKVYDYFNGAEDLQTRTVRFVGDARQRVEEDYLRILRYFRFAARFDAQMDDTTLAVFSDGEVLDRLNVVSVERFWLEMSKLLTYSARVRIMDAIFRTGVNRSLGVFRFNPVELINADDALAALATLVATTDLDKFFDFWKMASDEEKKVRWLVSNRNAKLDETSVEVMLLKTPRDYVVSLAEIRGEPTLAQYARDFAVPTFPVTGKDLMASGMKPGPEMGQRLRRMESAWIFSRFNKSKDELMGME